MSSSTVNNFNLPFEPAAADIARIAPEPESRLSSVFSSLGSVASGLLTAGANSLVGSDYSALITAQLQAQREMQVVSMVSNVEKSKHETQMAAIRNVRVS